MGLNNDVVDGCGNIVGFECRRCGKIASRMWGTTCNECRDRNRSCQLEHISKPISRVMADFDKDKE